MGCAHGATTPSSTSSMDCEFNKGRCWRCGRINATPIADHLIKFACLAPVLPCPHLGEFVGHVLVQCQTCSGNVRLKQPAHKCDSYNRCLPTFWPIGNGLKAWVERKPESDIYQLCATCPSNPNFINNQQNDS